MSPNLHIAFRFLTAKKRAMLMSLSCIILGVGLFIVTQAATTGFEGFFIRTILGTDGAMRIQDKLQATQGSMAAGGYNSGFEIEQKENLKYIEGIEEPGRLLAALSEFENVSGASAVLRGSVVIRSSFQNQSIQVFGIDLAAHVKVSDLGNQIVDGSLTSFRDSPSGAILGREMANRLHLNVDDSFQLEALGQVRRYRVSAIYETGVSDIDRLRLYLNMIEARSLLKEPIKATFLQINLANKDRAPEDAAHMQQVLGYSAEPWQQREKSWLSAFSALRITSGITVSVFTLIAGLAMFNTLAMIVLEKTKDIAILRSMGYERADITRIFLWQAGIVLVIGIVIGGAFGAGASYAISRVPLPHGGITGIFATKYFIVDLRYWHIVQAAITAIFTVMIASLVPARRAARLEPGDIVRGTAL